MTPIPPAVRKIIDNDPFYKNCAFYGINGHVCSGRVTLDHAIIFGGKQVQRPYAIVPICAHGHGVDQYQDDPSIDRQMRLWVALNRATEAELIQISKAENYIRTKNRLNDIYGAYTPVIPDLFSKQKPVEKGSKRNWHLVTDKESAMIEKIRQFQRTALGINEMPRKIISSAIESAFLEVKDQLLKQDSELYKKLGFDQ